MVLANVEWSFISRAQLAPPHVSVELVSRPRLLTPLCAAVGRQRLLLLCAPAGSGKTALLVQLVDALRADVSVAWVSVGEDDNLSRFVSCLLQALEPMALPWRKSPQLLPGVAGAEGGLRSVVEDLQHALASSGRSRGLLVVDDLHRLTDARAFAFLDHLGAALPAGWTLALASRIEPPLARSRLFVQGDMQEVREEQLRFRDDEALLLMTRSGCLSTPEQAHRLMTDTGGWAAGVRLWLQAGTAAEGGHRRVRRRLFQYLAQEVLSQLPDSLQAFLLRASLLPQLTPSRCSHLCDEPAAAAFMAELQRRELFVVEVDGDEFTLRLHELFRDFLEDELLSRHLDELPALLSRAADREADLAARLVFRLRAGDVEQAADDLLHCASAVLSVDGEEPLLQLVSRFPLREQGELPQLAFVRGLCAAYRDELQAQAAEMHRAAAGFELREDRELATQARSLADLALLQLGHADSAASLAPVAWSSAGRIDPRSEATVAMVAARRAMLGDRVDEAVDPIRRLTELVPSLPEWHWVLACIQLLPMGGGCGLREPLSALAARLERAAQERPRLHVAVSLLLAWLAVGRGDLDRAATLRRGAESDALCPGQAPLLDAPVRMLGAVLDHLQGRSQAACDSLERLSTRAGRLARRGAAAACQVLRGELAAAAGLWDIAEEVARSDDLAEAADPSTLDGACTAALVLRAEIALAGGRSEEALRELQRGAAHTVGPLHRRVEVRGAVTAARAHLALGRPVQAWGCLASALRMVQVHGELGNVLLCGRPALQELLCAPWGASCDRELFEVLCRAVALLDRFAPEPPHDATAGRPGVSITERERQVLECVYVGQSNKAIARDLGLSPHTVKRHLARLFTKSGRNSRGELAAWYRSVRPAFMALPDPVSEHLSATSL